MKVLDPRSRRRTTTDQFLRVETKFFRLLSDPEHRVFAVLKCPSELFQPAVRVFPVTGMDSVINDRVNGTPAVVTLGAMITRRQREAIRTGRLNR